MQRILLIRLSALGDVIQALYAAPGIRRAFPNARLSFAVEKPFASIVSACAEIDETIALDRKELALDLKNFQILKVCDRVLKWKKVLRAKQFDLSLDFQGNLRSALVSLLAGAKIKTGPSADRAKENAQLFYAKRLRVKDLDLNKVLVDQALANQIGAQCLASDKPTIRIPGEIEKEIGDALFSAGLPESGFVQAHPGVSFFGAYKRYEERGWAKAIEGFLVSYPGDVLLSYGPGEEEYADAIQTACSSPRVRKAPPTPTVLHLAELIRRSRFLAGSDSGPLHLAALLSKRVVGIYGPKDPKRCGPYGDGHIIVEPADLSMRSLKRHARKNPISVQELPPHVLEQALIRALNG